MKSARAFGLGLLLLYGLGGTAVGQPELRILTTSVLDHTFGTMGLSSPSEDGRVVGGDLVTVRGFEPTLWRRDQGFERLPLLPDLVQIVASATAVSADGSVAAGQFEGFQSGTNSAVHPGFRWEQGQGTAPLGDSVHVSYYSQGPKAISENGKVITGTVSVGLGPLADQAFRWTDTGGFELLLNPNQSQKALDLSADGQVIVGQTTKLSETGSQAFRWTETFGYRTLVDVDPTLTAPSTAFRVVDGHILGVVGNNPFVWKDDSVTVLDADLPDRAIGMGGDFSGPSPELTVLAKGGQAIWTSSGGLKSIKSSLSDWGLSDQISGWTDISAKTISKNGKHIVGEAFRADGIRTVWIVSVPEPSTGALLGLASLCGLSFHLARFASRRSLGSPNGDCPRGLQVIDTGRPRRPSVSGNNSRTCATVSGY